MNLPIPTPTPEQVAASVALENSRRQYRLQDRAKLLVLRQPDVVMAARDGEPPLVDAKPTLAPQISKQTVEDFKEAMSPNANTAASAPPAAAPTTDGSTPAPTTTAAAPTTAPAAPLQLQEVQTADPGTSGSSAVMTAVPGNTAAPAATGGGNSMGVEIISPSSQSAPDNGGLKAVGPVNATPLPAAEKPGAAPDAVNDIAPGTQPAAQTPNANGKNPKPEYDKSDESSSKHKKKKGLAKLNPF